jgi:hypothetical protein
VTVPAGSTYARFSLFDANTTPGSDLDLYVFNSGGTQVGGSGSGTSAEEVNLLNPAAGSYTVLVDGYGTANPSTFTLFTWVLGLTFSGLTAGTKYLGSVAYDGASGMPNPTIVRVDTP